MIPFSSVLILHFYPRPPRGGRRREKSLCMTKLQISIHALREEGDPSCARRWKIISKFLSTPSARRATAGYVLQHRWIFDFYPRPPRGGRHPFSPVNGVFFCISIHALREEGDSKNGEKHLRFCFIIKRSAQIWKSLSKNIRKNSCDLHRTA